MISSWGGKLEEIIDTDSDGIVDTVDICPGSVTDHIRLKPNHYAQNIDFGFFEIGPDNHQSKVYDMSTTKGCTCKQIIKKIIERNWLEKLRPKNGCSPKIMAKVTGISPQPDRQYWNYWEN